MKVAMRSYAGTHAHVLCAALAAMAAAGGCMPEITMEDMKAMKPQRPPELDRLNMLVGTWHGTGTADIMGMDEPIQISGTGKTEWQADGWYLVEHSEYKMGDMEPMKAIGIWTWDEGDDVYRSFYFDTMGAHGEATARYDEETQMWKMRAKGSSPMGSTKAKGTIHATGDTMTWTWKEYPRWDIFRIFKIVEMQGTSTRK